VTDRTPHDRPELPLTAEPAWHARRAALGLSTPRTRREFLALIAAGAALAAGGAVIAGCQPVETTTEPSTSATGKSLPPYMAGEPNPTSTTSTIDVSTLGPPESSGVNDGSGTVATGDSPAPGTLGFTTFAPDGAPGGVTRLVADVCVVGGGAAGMSAATAAARAGALTVLLEESYVLGGNVTRGTVNLDRIAYNGPPMVAGYFEELLSGMVAEGEAIYPTEETSWVVPFEPDALRARALRLALKVGVDVRLGHQVMWVEHAENAPRTIAAVWATNEGSLVQVRASTFIDCTGDGNLGFMAGSSFWFGDRTHGQIQGQTLIFHAGPVEFDRMAAYARLGQDHLVNEHQIVGFRELMAEVHANGMTPGSPQRGALVNRNMNPSIVSISVSEVYGNHLAPGGMTEIMRVLEVQNRVIHDFFRTRIPGMESSHIVRMAERPYLREGRRLIGLYQLTGTDVVEAVQTDDSIARGWYPIDLHMASTDGPTRIGYVPAGKWYSIPYRCLVARDLDNLLVAGRCLSATHEALGSVRVSPASMAVGQAAGVAAALSAQRSSPPAKMDVQEVRKRLLSDGALI
jgi:hypothetical protein